jgi:hypothetical protein
MLAGYVLNGRSMRRLQFDWQFYDFIIFAANVFVRLSDLKLLRHSHVSVESSDGFKYLAITPPDSKTSDRESLSMERAVTVYLRLRKRQIEAGFGKSDDYVFYPEQQNRDYALAKLRRLFDYLVSENDLKRDRRGKVRTLYSLRHTALMFRFLRGDKIDIFVLAKNALTSVEMLEKFYLSHAESRSKIGEIQSFRQKK